MKKAVQRNNNNNATVGEKRQNEENGEDFEKKMQKTGTCDASSSETENDSEVRELKQLHIERCTNLISECVIVRLKGEKRTRECSGYLFTVDPETGNLVLLRPEPQEDAEIDIWRFTPIVVFFSSILSVSVDEKASKCELPITLENGEDDISFLIGADNRGTIHKKELDEGKTEEKVLRLLNRRRVVKELLTKNRLNVREVALPSDGNTPEGAKKWRLEVMGGIVQIDEPFDSSSCTSSNSIVLTKIQHLLDSLSS